VERHQVRHDVPRTSVPTRRRPPRQHHERYLCTIAF
jgi:hypothetical protein